MVYASLNTFKISVFCCFYIYKILRKRAYYIPYKFIYNIVL